MSRLRAWIPRGVRHYSDASSLNSLSSMSLPVYHLSYEHAGFKRREAESIPLPPGVRLAAAEEAAQRGSGYRVVLGEPRLSYPKPVWEALEGTAARVRAERAVDFAGAARGVVARELAAAGAAREVVCVAEGAEGAGIISRAVSLGAASAFGPTEEAAGNAPGDEGGPSPGGEAPGGAGSPLAAAGRNPLRVVSRSYASTLEASTFDFATLSATKDAGELVRDLELARRLLRPSGRCCVLITRRDSDDDLVRELEHALRGGSSASWGAPRTSASPERLLDQLTCLGRFSVERDVSVRHRITLRGVADLCALFEATGLPPSSQPGVVMDPFTRTRLKLALERRYGDAPFRLALSSQLFVLKPAT